MDQQLSRPARWASAPRRAREALYELQNLRDEWLAAREELVEKWNSEQSKFANAVGDLEALQSEYRVWSVPDNLLFSRLQDKINFVSNLSLSSLNAKIPDLEKLADPLEDFNPVDDPDFGVIDEAAGAELPKGYGRD